jgi:hypothetical protein
MRAGALKVKPSTRRNKTIGQSADNRAKAGIMMSERLKQAVGQAEELSSQDQDELADVLSFFVSRKGNSPGDSARREASAHWHQHAEVRELDEAARHRLQELEDSRLLVNVKRSYDGPLPVIRLAKPVRLDRIIKVAKR